MIFILKKKKANANKVVLQISDEGYYMSTSTVC